MPNMSRYFITYYATEELREIKQVGTYLKLKKWKWKLRQESRVLSQKIKSYYAPNLTIIGKVFKQTFLLPLLGKFVDRWWAGDI